MQIWGQTLFKNEERWLWYCVTSVIDHLDKLLLWDTGSTDNSFKIAQELAKKYPDKIDLRQYGEITPETFKDARQAMLNETKADWFLVVDADEIWPKRSIEEVIKEINFRNNIIESIVVPTINLVGDVFHYQPPSAGRYKFGEKVGHYNLRAIKIRIPGLHSQNPHGTWGWADNNNQMIQDRGSGKVAFVDAPYLHATFLPRGEKRSDDFAVPKRARKLKYEIGENLPLDYFYPEVFFIPRPKTIISPWGTMNNSYKFRAFIETPLRKLNRRLISGKAGY
jgi:glycosyltransferase involved in cell wall biosynthesis